MGLLLLLLASCHRPPTSYPEEAITLGWRLAPGMELTYRLASRYAQGGQTVVREETWTYLVRSVDDLGSFSLEGRIVGLEARIEEQGTAMDSERVEAAIEAERERLTGDPVAFTLSMDGRIATLDAPSWADGLPHRLLGLRLPTDPVREGDRWPDPAAGRPFVDLVPAGLAVDVNGVHRLEALSWAGHQRRSRFRGPWHLDALFSTEAIVRPDDARVPALVLSGSATWNLDLGRLESRTLEVEERGGTSPGEAGAFSLRLEAVPLP
ncbi:MAG: hypothetical protein JXB39_07040 [Deltaproteobacteria bacterium]|nr:hypothetical protein [Deltaproteobacteria bacterium]